MSTARDAVVVASLLSIIYGLFMVAPAAGWIGGGVLTLLSLVAWSLASRGKR